MSDLLGRLVPAEIASPPALEKVPQPQLYNQQHARSNVDLETRLVPAEESGPPGAEIPRGWSSAQTQQQSDAYTSLIKMSGIDAIQDANQKEQERAKIQVSLALSKLTNLDPATVYLSWDDQNHSPIASAYFKTVDLPLSYAKRIANEFDRANKQYQSTNVAMEMMFSKFDPEKYKKYQGLQTSMPPADKERPGLGGFFETIPLMAINQYPWFAEMLAAGGVGSVIGGAIGSLVGPEGTVAGATLGARIAAGASSYRMNAAQVFGDIMSLIDDKTGKPMWQALNPEQMAGVARAAALVAGAPMAALDLVGVEAMLPKSTIEKLATGIIKDASKKGLTKKAFAEFFKKWVGGSLTEGITEAAQDTVGQIAQDVTAAALNDTTNSKYPKANWGDYGRLMAQSFSAAARGSLLYSLPGAVSESRTLSEQATAAAKNTAIEDRVSNLISMQDDTRPLAERAAAIDKRVEELTAAQKTLTPQVTLEGVSKITPDLASKIDEFRTNEHELAALKLLKNEQEANDPNAPWRKAPEEITNQATGPLGMPKFNLTTGEAIQQETIQREGLTRAEQIVDLDLQRDVLAPTAQLRQVIEELSPGMDERQREAVTLLGSAIAYAQDLTPDEWLARDFTPQIAVGGELPTGTRGAAVLMENGKTLLQMSERSDFSTWAHEFFHDVFNHLPDERKAPMAEWSGALAQDGTIDWARQLSEQARDIPLERLAQAWVKYLQEGVAPTPELKSLFQRMAEWLVKAWELVIGKDWQINDDIRSWMSQLLTKPDSGIGQAQQGTATEVQPQAPRPSGERAPTGELELFQTAPAETTTVFDQAVQIFGITEDLNEAGYILPDGRMLDFSGRHLAEGRGRQTSRWAALKGPDWKPQPGLRSVPHGEILGSMYDFIRQGAIRTDAQAGVVMLARRPTVAQEQAILEIAETNNGLLSVEIPIAPTAYESFISEADPQKALGAIRAYFRTGKLPEARVLYQTEPTTVPDLAEDIQRLHTAIRFASAQIAKLQAGDIEPIHYDTNPQTREKRIAEMQLLVTTLQRVTDKGMMFKDAKDPQVFAIVHRSTKPEDDIGRWRVSNFDNEGPAGHRTGILSDLITELVLGEWQPAETRGATILSPEQGRAAVRPDILYQPEQDQWYLRSQRLIQTKMAGPMPGRQVLKMLQNAGIKEDELKWTGLSTYLDTDERRSPKDIQALIEAEAPQLTENVRGGTISYEEAKAEILANRNVWGVDPATGMTRYSDPLTVGELERLYDQNGRFVKGGEGVKYKNWTLPGGENYRELLLTLPPIGEENIRRDVIPGKEAEYAAVQKKIADLNARLGIGESAEYERARLAEGDQLLAERDTYTRPLRPAVGAYTHSHWDESNILAHARFNERLDSEGRRVLFVEEIQSDWHQKGREKGYAESDLAAELDRSHAVLAGELANARDAVGEGVGSGLMGNGETFWDKTREKDGDYLKVGQITSEGEVLIRPEATEQQAAGIRKIAEVEAQARAILDQRDAARAGVPDAPFRKTWHELMFRRMLRWAAENDFDVLAWTTGEQQAERYNLSKQVVIEYGSKEGGYWVHVWKADTDETVLIERGLDENKLADLVGKEVARKIVDGEGTAPRYYKSEGVKRLAGDDLKIGGEGMKGFYDKILVDYAKKYLKQWGAKVGETLLSTGKVERYSLVNRGGGWRIVDTETHGGDYVGPTFHSGDEAETWLKLNGYTDEPVHSLTLTPEMRESVLQGQTLFQPEGGDITGEPPLQTILDGISKGMPIPDRILESYRDTPQVAAEIQHRKLLMDQARKSNSPEEFTEWMIRAAGATPATEAYYKLIYKAAQNTEDPGVAGERFLAVLDDQTLKDLFAEIQFIEGDNPESSVMQALTPEMRELAKAAVKGQSTPEALTAVRNQIADNPDHWRQILKENLPNTLESTKDGLANKEVDADSPTDFRPVTARQANNIFIKMLDAGGLEPFLVELYVTNKMGAKQKTKRGSTGTTILNIAASKAHYGTLDASTWKSALREIRNDATYWRGAYATMYSDRDMILQLDYESAHADEAEDIRIRKENSRLREKVNLLVASGKMEADLSDRKIADLQAMVQDKEADVVAASTKVGAAQKALEEVAAQLSEHEKETAQAEIGAEPPADASPLLKAYYRRLQRLEEQIAFQRQAQQQAAVARVNSERALKLTTYIHKPVDPGIADAEARMIEDIQSRLEYNPDDVDAAMLNRLKEWRRQNPNAELPPDLVQQIERRQPREMILAELEDIAIQIRNLRHEGRLKRDIYLATKREMYENERENAVSAIRGTEPGKIIEGLGTAAAAKEVRTPKWKTIYWGTLRMNRLALTLDGGKPGPFTKWLWDKVNDATDAQLNEVHRVQAAQEAKLKELGLNPRMLGKVETYPGRDYTHAEMVGVYIYSQFEKGLFSLQTDNKIHMDVIKQITAALSKEEKAFADWMIDTLSTDEDFDRLQAAELDFHNKRMVREGRYFPFVRRDLGNKAFMSEIADNLLEMRGLQKRRGAPGFLKARADRYPGQVFPPLKLDAPSIFNNHVQQREWFIANADLIKSLNRIFHSELGGREVRNAILEKYGDAMVSMVDKYIGAYENPNIYRAADDWGGLTRLLRSNVSVSLLGFNVMTMLRQLPDIPQIMVQAGPIDAIGAVARLVASPKETIDFFHENAPQYRDRSYDRMTEEFKLLNKNAYERAMRKVGEAGFVALQVLDTTTNVIGWTAIYNRTMRETGNHLAATKAARDFLLVHRPAARAKDLAQFYREPGLASWFLMFTNQQNQQWNLITQDIPKKIYGGLRSGNMKMFASGMMEATALMVGAVGMALVARKRFANPDEYPKDLLAWIFGNVPFVGNDMEAAIRGQGNFRGAISPFVGPYNVAKATINLIEGEDTEKTTRAAMNALWELARTSGLPIIQGKRIYQTINTGDPWDLLGGPPKAAGE